MSQETDIQATAGQVHAIVLAYRRLLGGNDQGLIVGLYDRGQRKTKSVSKLTRAEADDVLRKLFTAEVESTEAAIGTYGELWGCC